MGAVDRVLSNRTGRTLFLSGWGGAGEDREKPRQRVGAKSRKQFTIEKNPFKCAKTELPDGYSVAI